MTQSLSKQTPNLVVVNRNGKPPTLPRTVAEDSDSARTRATDTSSSDVTVVPGEEDLSGFVFEEVEAVARPDNTPVTTHAASSRAPEQQSEAAVAPQVRGVSTSTASVPAPQRPSSPAKPTSRAPLPSAVTPPPFKTADRKGEPENEQVKPAQSEVPNTPAQQSAHRGELELRAKLNQKEAELLSLRSELSSRDRTVLDLNNASLEIERSRTELSEKLDQQMLGLSEANLKLRALEVDKEAASKRIEELKNAQRRSDENWKRKLEAELGALKIDHATQLAEQAALYATKLEQLEQAKDVERARMQAAHAAAEEEAREKHAEAIRAVESASSRALSNAVSAYTRKVRALQEMQERAIAKAAAADSAKFEAAMAAAASERENALAEADSTLRATQNELAATNATVELLKRNNVSQQERITQQEAKLATLEEALQRATAKAGAAAETLATLRRAFAAGLSVLNAPQALPESKDE